MRKGSGRAGRLLGRGWAVVLVVGAWESFSVAWGSPRLIEDDCAGPWRNASPFLLAFGGCRCPASVCCVHGRRPVRLKGLGSLCKYM